MTDESKTTPAERFAAAILRPFLRGDISQLDGFDIEEIAFKAGLLEQATVEEPCGERCSCAECGAEFPTECNRLTEAGKALPHVE